MTLSQILALSIFVLMFAALASNKIHRFIAALVGAAIMISIVFLAVMKSPQTVITVFNLGQLGELRFWVPGQEHIESQGINWQTIIFIGGMMVMIEGLGIVGFFRWICLYTARLVRCKAIPILMAFIFLSGFLAMFIDSITVMLFLSSVTIELGQMLKFNPVPMIIAEIFAANTGGSATMCGDPPNIIVGTAFGYTFTDFVVNTGPIAWIGMLIAAGYFYIVSRKIIKQTEDPETLMKLCPVPSSAIVNPPLFKINSGIFLLVVILLVTHAQTGISVATIGVIAAVLTLIFAGRETQHVIKRFDWRTILFFIGLFICVGGLEETGVLKLIAEYIGNASGDNLLLVVSIILWGSAFASALVDNIPFAATMVPIIRDLSQIAGFKLTTLAWALSLGTDIGGNATPIGASANVVGVAIAERNGYPISWGTFLKYALPGMILVVASIHVYLILRYI